MRRTLTIAACALLLLAVDDGEDAGRRGNDLYEAGDYAAAAAAYRDGLAALSDTTGAVYAALQNNLGAALHQQEDYTAARRAFERARRAAPTDAERARALYNAGNAALGGGQLQTALSDYRRALRHDPDHADARFNYEYVAREMKKRQAQQRRASQQNVEPSPYAKRLKRRADALAAEQRYQDALDLMTEGLQADSTVAAFRGFMTRLRDVATIDQSSPPSQP